MKKVTIDILLILLIMFPVGMMNGGIIKNMCVKLTPSGGIPLGSSADSFKFGKGAVLEGRYLLIKMPGFFINGNLEYNLFPIKASNSVSVINFEAVGGIIYSINPKLYAEGFPIAGGYYGALNAESGVSALIIRLEVQF